MARNTAHKLPPQILLALGTHLEAARAHMRQVSESGIAASSICERVADGKGKDGDADRIFSACVRGGMDAETATGIYDSAVMVLFLDAA